MKKSDIFRRKSYCICWKQPCLNLAKRDEKYNPHLVCPRPERKIGLMISGWIYCDGVGTLTAVKSNINSAKYFDILENNLWPWQVIVWYFEDKEYLVMEDNAAVHRDDSEENYKDENETAVMNWLAQSPDLHLIENIWLYIKRKLQKSTTNIVTNIRKPWSPTRQCH